MGIQLLQTSAINLGMLLTGMSGPGTSQIGPQRVAAVGNVHTWAKKTAPGAWKFPRAVIANRLQKLIMFPHKFDQGSYGLCSAAAFFYLVMRRFPIAVATFAMDLYDTGEGQVGNFVVTPDQDLINNDFVQYKTDKSKTSPGIRFPPLADWMMMSAIRDDFNWLIDYEGKLHEEAGVFSPISTGWLQETGFYAVVEEKKSGPPNLWQSLPLSHASDILTADPKQDVLMDISTGGSSAFLKHEWYWPFTNHRVALNSPIIHNITTDEVSFQVFSWGKIVPVSADRSDFEENYFGHIRAEVA